MSDEDRAVPDVVPDEADARRADGSAAPGESTENADADQDLIDVSRADDGDLTPRQRRELRAQRERERRVWAGLIGAGVIVLIMFLLAFWPIMAGRLNAAKQLDQAQALLAEAANTMAPVDKTVDTQLSATAAVGFPSPSTEILVTRRDLDQAVALVTDAMPHLTEDEQKRAELIRTAAQARRQMLKLAPTILAASVKAVVAKSLVDRASALSARASSAEIAAASSYGLHTASAVETASVSLQRVAGQLKDARSLYSQAATAFPDAGFARYVAYVDQRRRGVTTLSKAASAWLGGDSVTAAIYYAAYEREVAKASAIVMKLPSAPSAPGLAFRKIAGAAVDAYTNAKKQALAAEKELGTP